MSHQGTSHFTPVNPPLDEPRSLGPGLIAGLAGALAFLVAMALDLALTRRKTNDLRLLAGLVPRGARHWPWLGLAMHCANGAVLGILYSRLRHYLSGPGWRAGLLFALAENFALWPVLLILDRVHPEVKAGRLEPFNRPIPFFQEIWRHVAYGVVLGWVHDYLSRSHPALRSPRASAAFPRGMNHAA